MIVSSTLFSFNCYPDVDWCLWIRCEVRSIHFKELWTSSAIDCAPIPSFPFQWLVWWCLLAAFRTPFYLNASPSLFSPCFSSACLAIMRLPNRTRYHMLLPPPSLETRAFLLPRLISPPAMTHASHLSPLPAYLPTCSVLSSPPLFASSSIWCLRWASGRVDMFVGHVELLSSSLDTFPLMLVYLWWLFDFCFACCSLWVCVLMLVLVLVCVLACLSTLGASELSRSNNALSNACPLSSLPFPSMGELPLSETVQDTWPHLLSLFLITFCTFLPFLFLLS